MHHMTFKKHWKRTSVLKIENYHIYVDSCNLKSTSLRSVVIDHKKFFLKEIDHFAMGARPPIYLEVY